MRWLRLAGALAAVTAIASGTLWWWRTRNVGAVQRGWQLASDHGCFGCHGPGGLARHPGLGDDAAAAPSFAREDLESYAATDEEIRAWILDGRPLHPPEAPPAGDERPLVRMPAWRGVLSDGEVDDLVAYVRAVGDVQLSRDPRAEAGRQAALRLGCFGCHGPQGRGNLPNPRSLKGYIPAWDGDDFPELARGEEEIAEWILDGRPRRLGDDRLARFFLDRQLIQMPAYRGRIAAADLEAIVHYVSSLRRPADAPAAAPAAQQGTQ